MHFSKKLSRRLALSVAVVGAVMALGASSASALSFSPAGPIVQSGTLTVKLDGGSPVTCTFNGSGSSPGWMASWMGTASCSHAGPSGTYWLGQQILSPTSVKLINTAGTFATPYPYPHTSAYGNVDPGTFVEGDATTPSKLVFNDTHVARSQYYGAPITWTGEIDVTTPSGGLVTIN